MAVTTTLTNVTTQVASLQALITAASPLKNAPLTAIAPIAVQAATTVSAIDAGVTETDGATAAQSGAGFCGVVAGGNPAVMIAGLLAQQANLNNAVTLQTLKGAVGRVSFNLQAVPG
ncbi:MAG: hypothetical protein JO278_15765 [Dyella sp.]|nr:hypothetical protein [Dyella sp.]